MIVTMLGTTVGVGSWPAWFAGHGAKTMAARAGVVQRYHAWLREAGLGVMQPDWWSWPGGVVKDEKTKASCYVDGRFALPAVVEDYLNEWQMPVCFQQLGSYYWKTKRWTPAAGFYEAARTYWTAEGLPTGYVYFDEVEAANASVEDAEHVRMLNEAAQAAGWRTVVVLPHARNVDWLAMQGIRPDVFCFRLDPALTGPSVYNSGHGIRVRAMGSRVAFYVAKHPAVESSATPAVVRELLDFCEEEGGEFLLYWNVLGPGGTVYRRAHPWFTDGPELAGPDWPRPTALAEAWAEAMKAADVLPSPQPATWQEGYAMLDARLKAGGL